MLSLNGSMQSMQSLLLDISLWSADLANLEAEIRRLEPFADSFHFDAADGHFVPSLLFFPDLIARLRPLTKRPFHVHLMAAKPAGLAGAFLDAGADRITFPIEARKRVRDAVDRVLSYGRKAGISLDLETPCIEVKDYLPRIDTVLIMGTPMGVKGLGLDERACDRIGEVKRMGGNVKVFADGGIREETVPLLRAAGADGIVPGSLVCGAPDIAARVEWLKSLV